MTSDSARVILEGELTIYSVSQRYEEWRNLLSSVIAEALPSIDIDTQGVIDIDTAGLQLLAYFSERATQSGITINWSAPSDAVAQAQQLYHVEKGFSPLSEAIV